MEVEGQKVGKKGYVHCVWYTAVFPVVEVDDRVLTKSKASPWQWNYRVQWVQINLSCAEWSMLNGLWAPSSGHVSSLQQYGTTFNFKSNVFARQGRGCSETYEACKTTLKCSSAQKTIQSLICLLLSCTYAQTMFINTFTLFIKPSINLVLPCYRLSFYFRLIVQLMYLD